MWNPFKKRNKKTLPTPPKVKVLPEVSKLVIGHKDGGPHDYDILNIHKRWGKAHRRRNDMKQATKKGAKHKRMKLKMVWE